VDADSSKARPASFLADIAPHGAGADEVVLGGCDQVVVLILSIFAPRAGVWMSSFLYIERAAISSELPSDWGERSKRWTI